MRIVKDYGERKREILAIAQKLFLQKGYDKCSVNDILKEIGIAKGTFYYYFSSKEEVLDAIIEQLVIKVRLRVERIVEQPFESSLEKLLAVAMAMRVKNQLEEGLLDELHRPDNALMHQKSLVALEEAMLPFFVGVIEEGIQSGVFQCAFPEEYMRIFLTSAFVLLDDGFFKFEQEEQQKLFRGLISILAKMLEIDEEKAWEMIMKHWQ